ncbi:hypothetical protein C8J57DRAFT_1589551, partial [Mycena rebaudengoi]
LSSSSLDLDLNRPISVSQQRANVAAPPICLCQDIALPSCRIHSTMGRLDGVPFHEIIKLWGHLHTHYFSCSMSAVSLSQIDGRNPLSGYNGIGVHRCRDYTCIGDSYLCEPCVVRTHHGIKKILHLFETWTGTHFQVRGLRSFGVRLQLGHMPHERCRNPVPAADERGPGSESIKALPSDHRHNIVPPTPQLLAVVCRTEKLALHCPPDGFKGGTSKRRAAPSRNDLVHAITTSERRSRRIGRLFLNKKCGELNGGWHLSTASRAAVNAPHEDRTDESLGWRPLCDTLAEWAVDAGHRMPRVTLEYPPEGFAYVTETDRVQIPEDPEDAEFIEGQSMEDIWSAVLERQAAAHQPVSDGTADQHFLAIPVRDIMPALLGGSIGGSGSSIGGSGDNSATEMTRGQRWCLEQMVKYDCEGPVTFE